MQQLRQRFQRLSVLYKLKALTRSSPILMTWVGMLAALGFVTGAALSVLVSPGASLRAHLPSISLTERIDPDVIMGHQGLADPPPGEDEAETQSTDNSTAAADGPLLVITMAERNVVTAAEAHQSLTNPTGLAPASWLLLLAMGGLGTALLSRQILSTSTATSARSLRPKGAPAKPTSAGQSATTSTKTEQQVVNSELVNSELAKAAANNQAAQDFSVSGSPTESNLITEIDYRQRQPLSDLLR